MCIGIVRFSMSRKLESTVPRGFMGRIEVSHLAWFW